MRRSTLPLLLLALPVGASAQSVVINIALYGLSADAGLTPLGNDRLLQFVNLGANGVFDSVAEGAWVGGDDTLVTAPYGVNAPAGQAPDFSSAAAFDAWTGIGGDPGTAEPVLRFQDLADGFYGIRWWRAYRPQDFYLGVTPAEGASYGEFTRASDPVYLGSIWKVSGGGNYSFDSLGTESFGGVDPDALGYASRLVEAAVIPEPSSLSFAFAACVAGVVAWRRRRRS